MKSIQPRLFSFDAEWVPDLFSAHALYGVPLPEPGDSPEVVRAKWAAGMEAHWAAVRKTPEDKTPWVKLTKCRLVSFAGILREERKDGVTLKLISYPDAPTDPAKCEESYILSKFLKATNSNKFLQPGNAAHHSEQPVSEHGLLGPTQLVGFNSDSSDIPIMYTRGMVHGVFSHYYGKQPNKPWEGADYHARFSDYAVDLKHAHGDFRNTPSLHEAATLCGIPGKIGTSGGNVAQMWLDGDVKGIVNYNDHDAFTTHLLWARTAAFKGLLSPQEYLKEQKLVENLLHAEIDKGKDHLVMYKEEWQRLQKVHLSHNKVPPPTPKQADEPALTDAQHAAIFEPATPQEMELPLNAPAKKPFSLFSPSTW